jgi:hypothetical protein
VEGRILGVNFVEGCEWNSQEGKNQNKTRRTSKQTNNIGTTEKEFCCFK